jgi:Na+-transporting methylmalonyl-CoA/oxaloacetate decarboxylase gamma subunit
LVTGKNSDFLGSHTDLVFLLLGLVVVVLGVSRFVKSERPSDESVQAEVKYRRQHGKWRWER